MICIFDFILMGGGYTEEFTDCTPAEVRADYEAHGCRVFAVDMVND